VNVEASQIKRQINFRSLWCAVANLASGTLLLINPVFASPENLAHIKGGSVTVAWLAVPLGFLTCIAALIQVIVALARRKVWPRGDELNKFAYIAIAFAGCATILMFDKFTVLQRLNDPLVWLVIVSLAIGFARQSKVQNLAGILCSALLMLLAISLALNMAQVY
jgi:hypothetical protein